jgi:uncharacterized membrane protein YfcA
MSDTMLVVLLGAVAGGFVQGLSGFGFGLSAMTIWVWALDPPLAATLVVVGSLAGQLVSVFTVKRAIGWQRLWPFLLGAVFGVPLGALLLPLLDIVVFKAALGLFLVVWCPLMLFADRLPPLRAGRAADVAAGGVGGLLSGIGGFSGVLPPIWCAWRRWPKDESRLLIRNFNISVLAVTFAVYVGRGITTLSMWPMCAIAAAATVVPALLGTRIYVGLSETAFRRVMLGVLTVAGLVLLVASAPAAIAHLF